MLKKLQLKAGDIYGEDYLTYELSKILVACIFGNKHALTIGAEQGDIEEWDDVIIEEGEYEYYHFQIKKQSTPFSEDECERDQYIKGPRTGVLRDLSEFDKVFASLAKWSASNATTPSVIQRKFVIVIPERQISIKNDLTIGNLKSLCEDHIKDGTTEIGLQTLAGKDVQIQNCFNWLKSWCDFTDWKHILSALRFVEIRLEGTSADIIARTNTELARAFSTPNDVRGIINGYVRDNTTVTGPVTPKMLLHYLVPYLLSSIPPWTKMELHLPACSISGINDLEDINEMERPNKIVPLFWNEDGKPRKLFINDKGGSNILDKPLFEFFHLAMHFGICTAYCVNWPEWKSILRNKVGLTLGTTEDDCNTFRIAEDTDSFVASSFFQLKNSSEREEFSKRLSEEIIKMTWQLVDKTVNRLITDMDVSKSVELRDAAEKRFDKWRKILSNNLPELKRLFIKALNPSAESKDIEGLLRIGPTTAKMLAFSLFLSLIVSIGLTNSDTELNSADNGMNISFLAIAFWSGPSNKPKKIQAIDDVESVYDLIGQEESDILIISKSVSSESRLYVETLASEKNNQNLATPHRPKVLITNNPVFKKLVNLGKVELIKDHFTKLIAAFQESRANAISNVTV